MGLLAWTAGLWYRALGACGIKPDSLIDRIYPRVTPLPAEEQNLCNQRERKRLADDRHRVSSLSGRSVGEIETAVKACEKLLDREVAIKQAVEARLSTILGLSTVASAISIVVLSTTIADKKSKLSELMIVVALAFGFYVILQFMCAIRAAIGGLERRGYIALTPGDCIPNIGERLDSALCRHADALVESLHSHRNQNNYKTTQMAVAHVALRNVTGSVLLMVALAFMLRMGLIFSSFLAADEISVATQTTQASVSRMDAPQDVRTDQAAVSLQDVGLSKTTGSAAFVRGGTALLPAPTAGRTREILPQAHDTRNARTEEELDAIQAFCSLYRRTNALISEVHSRFQGLVDRTEK